MCDGCRVRYVATSCRWMWASLSTHTPDELVGIVVLHKAPIDSSCETGIGWDGGGGTVRLTALGARLVCSHRPGALMRGEFARA